MSNVRRATAAPQRVVGIGASAGGLDALKRLVASLPIDTGLAYVVLQHLPPSQIGQLAMLLASTTTMPVIDVVSGHRIKPNTILVVPPHVAACLLRGALVLRASKPGVRPRLPIDGLLRSLADVLGERAIGVVLSGSAQDGTEGLRAIHDVGGLTFAQDPATAQFDDMPRSAIAAGVVEAVLAPEAIGAELAALGGLVDRAPATPAPAPVASAIDRVLVQLREASGIDFTSYKRSTIERRLARRIAKHHLATLEDYSKYLAEHRDEAAAVYEDLLIHATEFFRDPGVFDAIAERILPAILDGKGEDAPLRVWVPGCSTGEEVYSFAIVALEQLGTSGRQLQLFGSDLSERAIETARRGHYSESIASKVSPERLQRFFRREDGGYRINRDVRERCVFVRHDLVNDPPFSKLDIVSCRNLLIYLGPALQKRAIPILHYALNQPGYLILGPAETIAGFESLFSTIDGEARIYGRKPAPRAALTFPITGRTDPLPRRTATRSVVDVERDVDHLLLARYAPACVVVDDNLDVVQFRGRTGPYLETPAGQPQLGLLRMARDGLAPQLPLAVQKARRSDAPVRMEIIVVREHGHQHRFHLEVVPLRGSLEAKRYVLLVFEDATGKPAGKKLRATTVRRGRESNEVVRARQELEATKEYLHSIVAQHHATSEELGITNEELQSANEELQSSNEELQTAKEELQSTNEELETVNDELQHGNRLLHEANDDLVNVLASVDIAIIIVDTERRVRRFTPRARSVMKLIAGDLGRPIADLQPSVTIPGLDAAIATVVETLAVHEAEVRDHDGTSYRMQIRPYRTADDKISGAVIAFVDITALRAARERAKAIVSTVPTPLVVLDDRLRVISANAAFCSSFRTVESDALGRGLLEIGAWGSRTLRDELAAVATHGTTVHELAVDWHGVDRGDVRALVLTATPIPPAEGGRSILVGIADTTLERRLKLAQVAATQERDAFLDAVSHELRTPLSAILLWAEALRDLEPGDPRRTQAIDTITQSARAEAQLVDDLLELALSRSAKLSIHLTPIDPSTIVQAAVSGERLAASGKQIEITTAIASGSTIEADPRRLRQIVTNLVSNAVKFTPAGGKVWVALDVANGAMKLSVRDTGPGIAPQLLPRVFEPFSQGDQSSTRAHRGLGIGLALVRHFVERQHGTIEVTSPGEGLGTTFTVRLPASSPGAS